MLTSDVATRLRKLNLAAGSLHLVSAIAIVALANNVSLPVFARYAAVSGTN